MIKDKKSIIENVLFINRYISNKSDKSYSGKIYTQGSGYHTVTVLGETFLGQRNESIRLSKVQNLFKNTDIVVDLGCNAGGTLHYLSSNIKKGYGFDFNNNCVNAANLLSDINSKNNLKFYSFNLEKEETSLINKYIVEDKIDWFFMLSISKWVNNWKQVAHFCHKNASNLLFEANGNNQQNQIKYLSTLYPNIETIYTSSDDDPGQKNRTMVICRK